MRRFNKLTEQKALELKMQDTLEGMSELANQLSFYSSFIDYELNPVQDIFPTRITTPENNSSRFC